MADQKNIKYTVTQSRLLYVYSLPETPENKKYNGYLKVGEVFVDNEIADVPSLHKDAVEEILDKREYTKKGKEHAGYEIIYIECTTFNTSKGPSSYKVQDVYDVLNNSGVASKAMNGGIDVWFKTDVDTIKKAIKAVQEDKDSFNGNSAKTKEIKFRPEQETAIKATVKKFNSDKSQHFLWNAKMRFGKTLAGLEVAKRKGYKTTLIVTHRPVVDKGWSEDFDKIFTDRTKSFYATRMENKSEEKDTKPNHKQDIELKDFEKLIKQTNDSDKNLVLFVSMQYLRLSKLVNPEKGDDNLLKEKILTFPWDFVMVDEAHEGTTTGLGERVINQLKQNGEKAGKKTDMLLLSGTPFNLLEKYEDNEIYTWDYVMEQNAKSEWDNNNFGDPNPYADLPRIHIFTFSVKDKAGIKEKYCNGETFSFHEFFRVWTGDIKQDKATMPVDKVAGEDFVHEDDVKDFIAKLAQNSPDNYYPFSRKEFREKLRHTFWIVPGVKEARALEKLLRNDKKVFGEDNGRFQIINVAGDGNIEDINGSALTEVEDHIHGNSKKNIYPKKRTITISCGKLTTGVSVPEWTAVLCMSGSENTPAANYMQTIFRVQTSGKKTNECYEGRTKTDCYVFDFAPERTLTAIAETSKMHTIAAADKASKASQQLKLDDSEETTHLESFLQLCPIISLDGTGMTSHNVTPNALFEKLKNVYIERAVRSGYSDNSLYNPNAVLNLNDEQKRLLGDVKELIGAIPGFKSEKIDVNHQGMTDEEKQKAKDADKKDREKKPKTQEEIDAQNKRNKDADEKRARISVMRGIAIRIPLLVYGAEINKDKEDEELDISNFTKLIDDASWEEYMPNGITKEIFDKLRNLFDSKVFVGAAKKIRSLVESADRLDIEERIDQISTIFNYFHNPDKETVLTPWRVVNMHLSETVGGWCFYDEKFDAVNTVENEYGEIVKMPREVKIEGVTENIFNDYNTRILEINSKTGLYPLYMAYSVFKTIKEPEYKKIGLTHDRVAKMQDDDYQKQADDDFEIWKDVLQDNIFVVCRTPMAVSITKRTLAGFRDDIKLNVKCYKHVLTVNDLVKADVIKEHLSIKNGRYVYDNKDEVTAQKLLDHGVFNQYEVTIHSEDDDKKKVLYEGKEFLSVEELVHTGILRIRLIKEGDTYKYDRQESMECDMIDVLRAKPEFFQDEVVRGNDFWGVYPAIPKKEKEDINSMKFNAIVGNPPYQQGDKKNPIYHLFVNAARDLKPYNISMIMPSRWFSGGRGLSDFRKSMIEDKQICILHDFMNSQDCFPKVAIEGGICYFLWKKGNEEPCYVYTHNEKEIQESHRFLNEGEMDIFLRDDIARTIASIVILRSDFDSFGEKYVFSRNPFHIDDLQPSDFVQTPMQNGLRILCRVDNERERMYLRSDFSVSNNQDLVQSYKIFMSKADGAAGQIGNPIPARIIGKPEIGEPNDICTETFLAIGPFTKEELPYVESYMKTKFFRFMVGTRKTKNMTKDTYKYVPIIDFDKTMTDEDLYSLFGLEEYKEYIEKMID